MRANFATRAPRDLKSPLVPKPVKEYRSPEACHGKWRRLNAECSEFEGHFGTVCRLRPSGFQEKDYIEQAQALWGQKRKGNESRFQHIDCWKIGRLILKWTTPGESEVEGENIAEDGGLNSFPLDIVDPPRPIGNKQARELKRKYGIVGGLPFYQ